MSVFTHDRNVEPTPPAALSRNAGHHWLREYSYDGHALGTICLQWQPNAKKWCRSGDVATGRDIDTRGWQYLEPCPMPNEAVVRNITTENNVWTALLPTEAEALEAQLRSAMFMEAEQHFKEKLSKEEQKNFLKVMQFDVFPSINVVNTGEILAILIRLGLPVSVTIGE